MTDKFSERRGPTPPRGASALLEYLLPSDDAPTVLGDLEEAYRELVDEKGRGAARRWYWREALRYVLRLLPSKMREMGREGVAPGLLRDVRFAARRLRRSPGFSAVVVGTLALGIGGTAAVFGLVDGVLFRPMPVADEDRLVEVYGTSERDGNAGGMFAGFLPVSYPTFEDLRDGMASLDGVFVHSQWPVSVVVGDEPERVDGLYVSASFFDVLGVRPALGRGFLPDEDQSPGGDAVVVLSHGFWERQFGSDPAAVGRGILINARRFDIVGVAPPGFRGTSSTLQPDLFVPVSMIGDVPPWGPLWTQRGLRFFNMGGRLTPGRSVDDLRIDLERMAGVLGETYPETYRDRGFQALSLADAKVNPNQSATLSRTGAVLIVMAGLVNLIACLNVANLLLARSLARSTELAVRSSLGATRGRLVRAISSEAALLFLVGGGLGLGLAALALSAVDGTQPPAFGGGALDVGMNLRAVGFTVTATFACMVLFGAGPALRAAGRPAAGRLRQRATHGTSAGRLIGEGLVLGQVALSIIALAGAGVFYKSLQAAQDIDPGFDVSGLGMMDVDLAAAGYGEDETRVFYTQMVEAAGETGGVLSAVVGAERPLGPAPLRRATRLDQDRSQAGTGEYVRVEAVTPGFHQALGIDQVEGRALDPGDRDGGRLVAVVNRRLAELLWRDGSPLEQQLVISLVDDPITVVGVVDNAKAVSLAEDPQPILYLPIDQHPPMTGTLFVRMADGAALEQTRRAVQALDPTLPVFQVSTAETLLAADLWTARATVRVLGLFGLIGLLLGGVGIYGVVSDSVRSRTREMGLRMALGAGRGGVVRTAVGRMLAVVGLGSVAGVLAAVLVMRSFAVLLVGVSPGDPRALAAAVLGLLVVAVLAAYLPAWRATRVDPMVVLRGDG